MKRLGMGLVGPGFVAPYHIEAVRRLGDVEVIGVAGSSKESAERKASEFKVAKAYRNYEELILDSAVDIVHITAPNHLHFPVCMMALQSGKHVICDKPLAITPEEGRQLRDCAIESKRANVVLFNYRGNPLIQQARSMVKDGEVGQVQFINGLYFQDWMADAGIYSWRYDSARAGRSFALADIGTHLCDLVQHVSGSSIDSVFADLTTVVPVRYLSGPEEHTFTHARRDRGAPKPILGEDLASVLLRFSSGAKGCFSIGQVLPGHKNDLQLEVCGRSGSLRWLQEQSNELWVGRCGEPNQIITKDPDQLVKSALHYTRMPAGHQSGWADALFNVISDAYDWIRAGGDPASKPTAIATFDDGYRICCIVDAMVSSHTAGGIWQKVSYDL